MAVTAQITQHTTTSQKQAGTVISLSATNSTLGTGNWHTHKFEWTVEHQSGSWSTLVVRDPRIGQNVDAAVKFRGFNFEFLADKAGEYDIVLTVTDEAGQSDSDTITITIPPSTRTNHYVDVNGSDTNGDGTQSNPWATVHKALDMLNNSSDWTLSLRAGQEHTFQPAVQPFSLSNCTNIEIGRYGTGADPIVLSHTVIRFSTGTENYYVHNMRMRPTSIIETGDDPFGIGGVHGVFSDVVVEGNLTGHGFRVPFFLHTGFGPASHICLLRCITQASREYSLGNQGGEPSNITCLGCSFGASVIESCVRWLDGPVVRSAFFSCDFDTMAVRSTNKSTIRFQWSQWGSCYRCRLRGGDLRIGEVETFEGSLGDAEFIRIDACEAIGAPQPLPNPGVKVRDNSSNVAIINSVLGNSDAGEELSIDSEDAGIAALLVAHNTFRDVTSGVALRDTSDSGASLGFILRNNLFLMANDPPPSELYFQRHDGNLVGYSVDSNAWTWPEPGNEAVWRIQNSFLDLAAWNALPQVGTDSRTNTTLDANLRPTSPTVVPSVAGVFEDYYGNPRTTVWAGAVGPVPPPPP